MSSFLLSFPVLLPVFGGLYLLVYGHFGPVKDGKRPFSDRRKLEWFVELITVMTSLILAWIIFTFESGTQLRLFRLFGNLSFTLAIDNMGRVFCGLIAFLWPFAVLYAFEYLSREGRWTFFFPFFLMSYGATAGIALAGNLLTLYLFYEMLTFVTLPLVLYPMTRKAREASRRYVYYSIGGAAFAFLSLVFVLMYSSVASSQFMAGGILNLDEAEANRNLLLLAYVFGFMGFGVKAVMSPYQGWLIKATVAPTPVTALLHAVAVVKAGAFAILRLTYFSFGTSFLRGSWAQAVALIVPMITIVYASTMAVRESHWKRRLAYSTSSNLSYIILSGSLMSPLGLAAALSHMIFHGIMKCLAFFCAGSVLHQTGKEYVYELDGLGKKMPITFATLTVASLSLIGIPLFAGFISKWNICSAAIEFGMGSYVSTGLDCLGFAAVAVILYSALMTAIYMLTTVVRAYFPRLSSAVTNDPGHETQPASDETDNARDPNWMMSVTLVVLAVVIIILGVHSGPLMGFLYGVGGEAGI